MASRRSAIIGTGLGYPARVVTNDELAKTVDTSDEWIRSRTGIAQRRFVDLENGQTITSIAVEGAEKALKMSGLQASDIDFVLCCTATPHAWMPIEAARIKDRMGLDRAAALDVNAACSGFVYGLHLADSLIRSGVHSNILVVGGDVFQNILNWQDRGSCVLFGDGAGAAVVSAVDVNDPSTESHIIGSRVYAALDRENSLSVSDKKEATAEIPQHLVMNGREVFKWATKCMAQAATEIIAEYQISPKDIDWVVPHQANMRIIEKVAEFLDFPMEKVYVNVHSWGNTSAGTIPICLAEMNEKGLLKKGQLILIDSFGGGFTWGSALIRW
jgi:3-oxoacyl-[acyl-carrier-protein] synthase III